MKCPERGFEFGGKIDAVQVVVEAQEFIPVLVQQVVQVSFHELVDVKKYFRGGDAALAGEIIVDLGVQFDQFLFDLYGFLLARDIVFEDAVAADVGLE